MRLKVFERDGWKCRNCGDETKTLHVHHHRYTSKNPWDESLVNLQTLCFECHEAEKKEGYTNIGSAEEYLLLILAIKGFSPDQIYDVAESIYADKFQLGNLKEVPRFGNESQ